jgi:hypothetical protein
MFRPSLAHNQEALREQFWWVLRAGLDVDCSRFMVNNVRSVSLVVACGETK